MNKTSLLLVSLVLLGGMVAATHDTSSGVYDDLANGTHEEAQDNDIQTNSDDIDAVNDSVQTNEDDISDNNQNISDNENAIESNDGDIQTNSDDIDAVNDSVQNNVENVTDNENAIESNDGDISDLQDSKADNDSVYTKSEVESKLDNKYDESTVDDLLDDKADNGDVYTQSDVDEMLSGNISDAEDYADQQASSALQTAKQYASSIDPSVPGFNTFTDWLSRFWNGQNFIKQWVSDNTASDDRVDELEQRVDRLEEQVSMLEQQVNQDASSQEAAVKVMRENGMDEITYTDDSGEEVTCEEMTYSDSEHVYCVK